MWLTFIWQNRRIAVEIIGAVLFCVIMWWFFFHNPKVIYGLKQERAELTRQVEAGRQAAALLQEIEKGKGKINEATFRNISTIRAAIIPHNTIIVR